MKALLQQHKAFEKRFKIKFDEPVAKVHTNGFISVEVNWSSKKDCEDFSRFKYPKLDHTVSGGSVIDKKKRYINISSASFCFPELGEEIFENNQLCDWFEICLVEEVEQNDFRYTFFELTKYGVIVWFAPRNWEDWDNTKPL